MRPMQSNCAMSWYAARAVRVVLAVARAGIMGQPCSEYSVLTHEQIVDMRWRDQIQPLPLKRFPQASEAELKKAHAYAYGGSVVQDMGYYPFGSHFFSDLVHYVRTGDFVQALIDDSTDLNEYAFALGALAHYASDVNGHPTINCVVAIEFPRLQRNFGPEVTYADDPKAHIRTEFGFDIPATNTTTSSDLRSQNRCSNAHLTTPTALCFPTSAAVWIPPLAPSAGLSARQFRK